MEKAKKTHKETLETRLLTLAKVYDTEIVVSILVSDTGIELLHTVPRKYGLDEGEGGEAPSKLPSTPHKLSSKTAVCGEESAYANYFG